MLLRTILLATMFAFGSVTTLAQRDGRSAIPNASPEFEYKLLATSRTTTMEREMNQAAAAGYQFEDVISGSTFFGGAEALVVMSHRIGEGSQQRYEYKLLATSKTSTMQKELQVAGDAGYQHKGQSVFKKTFGTEVMVILERDRDATPVLWEYKLLATRKTSTMQSEMLAASNNGYQFVGFTTGETFFGGTEVVTIMRRPRR
ncbi:MAG: hypothetical protein ABIP75_14200 [Pyrinomonadaceae bacterium]